MSFTYATLKTAIQDYTENTETTFVTHLPDFIKGAEERLLKTVQLSVFRKNSSGTMTSTNQYLAVPRTICLLFLYPIQILAVKKCFRT